jgi:glutathione S-transferase
VAAKFPIVDDRIHAFGAMMFDRPAYKKAAAA